MVNTTYGRSGSRVVSSAESEFTGLTALSNKCVFELLLRKYDILCSVTSEIGPWLAREGEFSQVTGLSSRENIDMSWFEPGGCNIQNGILSIFQNQIFYGWSWISVSYLLEGSYRTALESFKICWSQNKQWQPRLYGLAYHIHTYYNLILHHSCYSCKLL